MTAYTYDSLPSADSLRVLSVETFDNLHDDIRCSMRSIPMSGGVGHLALSYSWGMDEDGDASICENITVDGKSLGVTRNIFHGLRRIFAGREKMVPIWIDAVCIDQSNVKERNDQVARMADIYANATQVLVWLGEGINQADNDGIATVLSCLRQPIHRHYSEHTVATQEGDMARLCLAHAGIAAATALNSLRTSGTVYPPDDFPRSLPHCVLGLFNLKDLAIAAREVERLLVSFATKRYWGRRWIVQEMFHADHCEVYVFWAGHAIALQELQSAFACLPGRFGWQDVGDMFSCQLDPKSDVDVSAAVNRLTNMLSLRQRAATIANSNFLAWSLESSNGYECSDPKDRLYALISMDPVTQLRPDHHFAPEDVYTSFCADLIKNESYLSGLLYSAAELKTQGKYHDAIAASLPSWCLDLREDFRMPQKRQSLGSCSVDDQRVLTCSALVLGTLSSDHEIVASGSSIWNDPEAEMVTNSYIVKYVYRNQCRLGDLICVFHADDTRDPPGTITMPAIILQALKRDRLVHRIVGLCFFRTTAWQTQGHLV